MTPNPFLGILFHAIGGFAAGSFYSPLKRVRGWHWETFWLAMGLAAWLAAPWIAAYLTVPNLMDALRDSPRDALFWAAFFGAVWGFGNLTFGLSVRYLGVGLGMGIPLGFCMVVGTLEPPIRNNRINELLHSTNGQLTLVGVGVCLLGIVICAVAGLLREKEVGDQVVDADAPPNAAIWGYLIAVVSGVLSAGFAIGLSRGKPIAEAAVAHGAPDLYQNNATLVVILLGGFLTNAICCLAMAIRNRSFGDYVTGSGGTLVSNYLLSFLGGVTWYCQFFFYGMGTTKLGKQYDFASWAIHMAFIIAFSNLWGVVFHEWRGTSGKTKTVVWIGILTLIASTAIFGWASYLASHTPAAT